MGPKVKKPPKNAFSFYLDDYVESEKLKGRQVSHKIAAEECGLLWKELSEEEKQKYTQIAAAYKGDRKEDKHNKFTSTGISYAQLEREQEEQRLKVEKADTEIKMTISNLDSELLKSHLFYIIHSNYYCKTDIGTFVPGEIAIVEFSLGDGVRSFYHTLINPGQIPLGYAYEARKMIEQIHGLPYPPYDEGDSDYFGILDKVLKFLEPGKLPDGRYPPLYCLEKNLKASENILQALSDNKCEGVNFFRVFPLHKMFFWLKNKCVECLDEENVGFPVMYNAESEITKDLFCYASGISCSFHITAEANYHNCSLSIAQRQVYTICDHCCQYVEVELVPGKHCWMKANTERRASSSREDRASQKSRPSPIQKQLDFDGRSSYADDFSCFDWKKEQGGSFLHEEIESKFSALEMSTVASISGRPLSTPGFCASSVQFETETGEYEEFDIDIEEFKPVMDFETEAFNPGADSDNDDTEEFKPGVGSDSDDTAEFKPDVDFENETQEFKPVMDFDNDAQEFKPVVTPSSRRGAYRPKP